MNIASTPSHFSSMAHVAHTSVFVWTNTCVSQHKHLLVHLSCHSITKTKQGPFMGPSQLGTRMGQWRQRLSSSGAASSWRPAPLSTSRRCRALTCLPPRPPVQPTAMPVGGIQTSRCDSLTMLDGHVGSWAAAWMLWIGVRIVE